MVDVTERRELNLQVREGRDPFEGGGKTGKADKGTDPHQVQSQLSVYGIMFKIVLSSGLCRAFRHRKPMPIHAGEQVRHDDHTSGPADQHSLFPYRFNSLTTPHVGERTVKTSTARAAVGIKRKMAEENTKSSSQPPQRAGENALGFDIGGVRTMTPVGGRRGIAGIARLCAKSSL
jgi:hypothetical protein